MAEWTVANLKEMPLVCAILLINTDFLDPYTLRSISIWLSN